MPSQLPVPRRPRLVELSYWLWFGACLVGLITAIVTLRSFGELKALVLAIVERQYPSESPVTREKVAGAAVATLIGAGALLALIQMAFAVTMRSGRGWARIVLVGLTLLGGLYVVTVYDAAPAISRVGMLANLVLMVTALVSMFLPGSRAWFAHRR